MNIARLVRGLPPPLRRHRLVRAMVRLSPESAIQEVRFNGGARLVADITDPFPRAYLLSGVFEPEFFALAAPFLRRGGAFLDVGANVGFCTFGLVHALGGGPPVDYHLFEANARLCDLLRRTVSLHPGARVTITHGCVTNAPGASRFRVVEDHLGASHVAPDGEEEVANVVLDDYLDSRRLDQVSLMKLDIEGLEPLALEGAARHLHAGRIRALLVEVSTDLLARQGFSVAAVLDPLRDAGFEVYYAREVDVAGGRRGSRSVVEIDVHGAKLRVAPVDACAFPSPHQTDLLAVHRAALPELAGGPRVLGAS